MKYSYKINIYVIITYLIFISVFKIYFLPEVMRQIVKIIVLVGVFLFICSKTSFKDMLNLSLIFSICVMISGVKVYLVGGSIRKLLESFLYALMFYDIYSFLALVHKKEKTTLVLKSLYRINVLYCALTIFSICIVGKMNNSNAPVYFFGNKFTSSYFFIMLIALFGMTHDMKLKRNKVILICIHCFAVLLTWYIESSTAMVSLIFLLVFHFVSPKIKKWITDARIVILALLSSVAVIAEITVLLNIEYIRRFVFEFLNKSSTVYGRLVIYSDYLVNMIKNAFWLGYGYSNDVMSRTTGMFSNAQNGLLEIMMQFGFIGVVALVYTIYVCYKDKFNVKNMDKKFYASFVVYGMIIAAIFEVTMNWFFIIGIFLVRWSCGYDLISVKNKKEW